MLPGIEQCASVRHAEKTKGGIVERERDLAAIALAFSDSAISVLQLETG